MFSGYKVVAFGDEVSSILRALAWENSINLSIRSSVVRFPGYIGDSGESLGMSLRVKPLGFDNVRWNAETVMRKKIRMGWGAAAIFDSQRANLWK